MLGNAWYCLVMWRIGNMWILSIDKASSISYTIKNKVVLGLSGVNQNQWWSYQGYGFPLTGLSCLVLDTDLHGFLDRITGLSNVL